MALFPNYTSCKVHVRRLSKPDRAPNSSNSIAKAQQAPKLSRCNSGSETTLPAVLPRPPAGTDRCPRVVSTFVRPAFNCLNFHLRNPCGKQNTKKKWRRGGKIKKKEEYPSGSSVAAVRKVPLRQKAGAGAAAAACSSLLLYLSIQSVLRESGAWY